MDYHCVKSFQIRSYFWSVFFCIWTEYTKIRTRNNSVFGHFSRSVEDLERADSQEAYASCNVYMQDLAAYVRIVVNDWKTIGNIGC